MRKERREGERFEESQGKGEKEKKKERERERERDGRPMARGYWPSIQERA